MFDVNVGQNKTEEPCSATRKVLKQFMHVILETFKHLSLSAIRLIQLLLCIIFGPILAVFLSIGWACHKFVRWFSEYRTSGVYLDADHLTYVEITRTKTGKPEIRDYGTRNVSSDCQKAMSPDPERLKEALSHTLSTGSVACLGRHNVLVTLLHLPIMTDAELAKDIPYEAAQYCPWDMDEVFIDYHVIERYPEEDEMLLMLICANKTESELFLSRLERSNFYPDRLGVGAVALVNVINFTQEGFDGQTVIINLDESGSTIVSMQKENFHGMSSSPPQLISNIQNALCGKAFDQRDRPYDRPFFHPEDEPEMEQSQKPNASELLDQMTERFDRIMEKAREELNQWEACMPPITTVRDMLEKFIAGQYPEDDVLSTIKESISALACSVLRRISVLRLGEPALRVFICGKYHNLPGIKDMLAEVLEVEVKPLDPTRNLVISTELNEKVLEDDAPELAIPIGLALLASDKPALQ